MRASVEGSFDDVVGRTTDADDGRCAEGGDGGDGIVHRIISDVAVLAVNYDAVEACQGDYLGHAD